MSQRMQRRLPPKHTTLDSLPVDVFSLLLPYLSFFDLLQMRAVCRALEQRTSECDLTMPKARSRVYLSKCDGRLRMQLGASRRLRYTEMGCLPNPRRLFRKIRADELRIVVQDSDRETLDFYEQMAAKCEFEQLHLNVAPGFGPSSMQRIRNLIRVHADKRPHVIFHRVDDVDLEMIMTIELPVVIYFSQTFSLEVGQIRDLINRGHTLEMVRSPAMSMVVVREIVEMLAASATAQLVSLDVPHAIFDPQYSQSHHLGVQGGEWTFEGKTADKLTEHRKWRRGPIRLTESRRRTENDEWYVPPPVDTRLVLANCEKESIAGIVYPDAFPPDEPETIAEELQELGARIAFSVRRFFGYR